MLTAQSRWMLYALTTLLVATGAAWLIAHFGRSEDALPSPVEPWSMKLHGAAAMAAIFARALCSNAICCRVGDAAKPCRGNCDVRCDELACRDGLWTLLFRWRMAAVER